MSREPEKTPKYETDPFTGSPSIPMTGRVARMHNITYVPLSEEEESEHDYMAGEGNLVHYRLQNHEPLFSQQTHFQTQGVRHFMDTPYDLKNFKEGDTPVVYPDNDGALWINDGHHRIIASRLKGDPYIDVFRRS